MAGRLVAEQQLGLLSERPGDRDALRLAAGQLAGKRSSLRREPDQGEKSSGASGAPVPFRRARRDLAATLGGQDREGDVLVRVKLGSRFAPWKT